MSNAVILTPTLFDSATLSNVGSEVATLPGTNLQDGIVAPRIWRTQNLTANRFDVDFGVAGDCGHQIRGFWLGYTNGTPHRNQITYTDDLDDTSFWDRTQIAAPAVDTSAVDPFEGRNAWKLLENTNNTEHSLEQVYTKPGSESMRFVASIYGMGITRSRCMLKIAGATDTNYASVELDTSGAGSVDTTTGGSGWTVNNSGFEDKGNGWYRFWIDCTSDASASARYRFNMLDDNGDVTYTGSSSKGWYVAGQQLEVYDSNQDAGPTVYVPVTDDARGALWKVLGDYDSADLGGGSEDYDSGWMNLTPQPGNLSDWDWVHAWHWVSSGTLGYRYYRIIVEDDGNADGYFQAGRAMIGPGYQFPTNPSPGWSAPTHTSRPVMRRTLSEYGELQDTRRIITASGEFWINSVSEYADFRELARLCGGNKPVLFVMDPVGDRIMDEMIYGPVTIQNGRETAGGSFRARVSFEEV